MEVHSLDIDSSDQRLSSASFEYISLHLIHANVYIAIETFISNFDDLN